MTSDRLRESWQRTEGYLRDARANFSQAAEALCSDEMEEFSVYLGHNELELALDMLDSAFEKSESECWRILELMAMAAASMGLSDRQRQYDDQLSKARGWKYETPT